jgi:hypothetical protein
VPIWRPAQLGWALGVAPVMVGLGVTDAAEPLTIKPGSAAV